VDKRSGLLAGVILPILDELKDMFARGIAAELNARNVATTHGGTWSAKTVIRVQRRLQG
jgi:hypothetical protein